MSATKVERKGPTCTLREACAEIGVSYGKLRALAVDGGEFTTARDDVGKGNPVLLRWDEVDVYAEGRLPALRKYRAKRGRR